MTTETTRTLEEIEREAGGYCAGVVSAAGAMRCVREAYALGAASRASPEEGRAEAALRDVLDNIRIEVEAKSGTKRQALARLELAEVRARAALRSPPAPTETRPEPPPLCTGSGTVNAAFMPVATSTPVEGTCGVCRQRTPLMSDGTTIAPHGYLAPPPPTEDEGARLRCTHPNWIECDSTCRAPASSKEGR